MIGVQESSACSFAGRNVLCKNFELACSRLRPPAFQPYSEDL
jgi:hypothetical protein